MDSSNRSQPLFEHRRFATTSWSKVVEAGNTGSENSRQALEELCQMYWYPLYAFVRRKGYSRNESADLTQGFFAHLLQNDRLQLSDQTRGRFRTFLISSITNFITQQWRRESAEKRGAGKTALIFDFESADQRFQNEPSHELSPERLFDRGWALTILDQAMLDLRSDYVKSGKENVFEVLHSQIGRDEKIPYAELGEQLQMSEGAIKVAIHRLRERYRLKLREIISQTVDTQDEDSSQTIDDEIRNLFEVLS